MGRASVRDRDAHPPRGSGAGAVPGGAHGQGGGARLQRRPGGPAPARPLAPHCAPPVLLLRLLSQEVSPLRQTVIGCLKKKEAGKDHDRMEKNQNKCAS